MTPTPRNIDLLLEARWIATAEQDEVLKNHAIAIDNGKILAILPIAEARERYIGRSTGYYQIDITNQQNELIATFESSVFRKDQQVPFTLK